MIIYEITTKVRLDLIDDYEHYMREIHILDLLDTGYFESAELTRVTDGVYRIQYYVKDRETLDEYIDIKAKELRDDFAANFPEGVEVSRAILEVLKTWEKN